MPITRRGVFAALALGAALPALAVADTPRLTMPELYADNDFSEQAKLFNGTPVELTGFMAPPLKINSDFFVLTMQPMAICPFCAEAAQWPEDIVVVYTDGPVNVVPYDMLVRVTGTLDLGAWTDPETGFVSKVRLVDAQYRRIPTVTQGTVGRQGLL